MPEAVDVLQDWHLRFGIEFAEGPVPVDLIDNMLDLKSRTTCALCANEGLWRNSDVTRIIRSRAADYLCYSVYSVGSVRRFHTTAHAAHPKGLRVCKHTHGEFSIAAAAGQHMMLAVPNACDGNQQTAQFMADDILKTSIPITHEPNWGRLDGPGLGDEVDEVDEAR